VIHLEAVSAATGEAFAREQVEAESRAKVLGRLGTAAASLREKLGESIGSVEKFAVPIEQATTSSLDAFKAYDLGRQKHFAGQYFEAIPLYRRAVELDRVATSRSPTPRSPSPTAPRANTTRPPSSRGARSSCATG
jgi:hypothetical protein